MWISKDEITDIKIDHEAEVRMMKDVNGGKRSDCLKMRVPFRLKNYRTHYIFVDKLQKLLYIWGQL